MKYLLDTNTCIYYLNKRSPSILSRIASTNPDDIVVCSVVKAELFAGAVRTKRLESSLAAQKQFLGQFRSLPFDDDCAEMYGRIRAELFRAGTPIGPNDLMIAAIALQNKLILVTNNVKEFRRVTGLQYEDWHMNT